MFDIEENLKKLPETPGVYIHKDRLGQVIYVGKAINLRRRVHQYFRLGKNPDPKVAAMVSHIAEFEYINCATEMEALILENNLIKKYMPKYNILLRDDKTYPYIKVTLSEKYPRILKTRSFREDGSRYFGPYSDVKAVDTTIEMLNDMFALKRCPAVAFGKGVRPCLNYHIGKCRGICQGYVDAKVYREDIEKAMAVISGRYGSVIKDMEDAMRAASEEMRFEEAAGFRDKIAALKSLSETQRAAIPGIKDMDIVLSVRGAGRPSVLVFYYRDGKLSGRDNFSMQAEEGDESNEIVSAFIKQHYGDLPSLPYEILTDRELPDREMVEEFLKTVAGRKVEISVPKRGDRKSLLDMAIRDCIDMCRTIDEKARVREERAESLAEAIYELVKTSYPDFPRKKEYRVESYDISNTNGVDTVGGMVVFDGLKPAKKDYRRFKIRTVQGPDDYGAMRELVVRRFTNAAKGDVSFSHLPDLLLIDGGKGQVGVVLEALEEVRLNTGVSFDLAVIGMAKDDHHRTSSAVSFVDGEFREEPLAGKTLIFSYMGTIQEEVHRFAIEYHRKLRGNRMITSALDDIPGIGPKKRNVLLAYFKGIEAIKAAKPSELTEAPGITEKNAEEIYRFFHETKK